MKQGDYVNFTKVITPEEHFITNKHRRTTLTKVKVVRDAEGSGLVLSVSTRPEDAVPPEYRSDLDKWTLRTRPYEIAWVDAGSNIGVVRVPIEYAETTSTQLVI